MVQGLARGPAKRAKDRLNAMSVYDQVEPTNEELWPQPPDSPGAVGGARPSQAMAPHQPAQVPVSAPSSPAADKSRFYLALASLGMGIPLSAIAGEAGGLPGLLVAWVGVVAVNFVYAWGRAR